MALNQFEQFEQQLEGKKHVLIAFDRNSKGDGICSSAALSLFLKKRGIRSDIISSDFSLPQNYRFVKHAKKIRPSLGHLQKFILSIDVEKTGVRELSYDILDNQLRIFVTPKQGTINTDNISTKKSGFLYDLIIVLDTPDLASLGSLYLDNADFFAHTPIINIDHKTNNEHFGHLNIVDVTASATSEILFKVCKATKPELIDTDIAEALLAGMVSGTNSFKSVNVRHNTLATASELVKLGADRNRIIKNLYQTKSIATFKLWGTALSNLEYNPELSLAWTTITRDELIRSGASELDLPSIIDELIANTPDANIILLLHEHADTTQGHRIHGIIQTQPPHNPQILNKKIKGTIHAQNISFVVTGDKTLKEVERDVLTHIDDFVKL